MEKCVNLNNDLVPEIEQTRTYNTEIMKKLDYLVAAEAVYQTYGRVLGEFALRITELQRAIIDGDDDSHINVQIHHLLGEFKVGEDLVYVLVAGEHRQQVFPVLEEAVERYKREAPVFKKESVITREGRAKAFWKTE